MDEKSWAVAHTELGSVFDKQTIKFFSILIPPTSTGKILRYDGNKMSINISLFIRELEQRSG